MNYFKKFLRDQRGVSPVIGVILMVAVTVVMGAVIAGFAYGYLGNTPKAPNVALSVIDDPVTPTVAAPTVYHLLIKHSGGENMLANDWKCSITPGKESSSNFNYQAETGAVAISTGTVLSVTKDTTVLLTPWSLINAGWYHVIVVHVGSDAILLDTNVLVR